MMGCIRVTNMAFAVQGDVHIIALDSVCAHCSAIVLVVLLSRTLLTIGLEKAEYSEKLTM